MDSLNIQTLFFAFLDIFGTDFVTQVNLSLDGILDNIEPSFLAYPLFLSNNTKLREFFPPPPWPRRPSPCC